MTTFIKIFTALFCISVFAFAAVGARDTFWPDEPLKPITVTKIDSTRVLELETTVSQLEAALLVKPKVEYLTVYKDSLIVDTVYVSLVLDEEIYADSAVSFGYFDDTLSFKGTILPSVDIQIWQDTLNALYHKEKFNLKLGSFVYKVNTLVEITEHKDRFQLYVRTLGGISQDERIVGTDLVKEMGFDGGFGVNLLFKERYGVGIARSTDTWWAMFDMKLFGIK